ncbi:hypothetical protein [Ellagibacter isourolithinifaciens]|uniref:hypothetical protein n=1 Tax=Ellagibacter isourolithinifaciens TaxID=2137581 RepID=UPI003AEFE52A
METVKAVRIGRALAEANLIIIGTSNGFDMAEGLNLFCADAHFRETYGDLAQTDGIGRILQGLASPDANVRRRWAERFHQKEYLEYEPSPLMNGLRHLTEHADTFVITCNINGHFARAGFNVNRVLETEGSIRSSIDERRLAHPDALAAAQLEELARLVQAHRNGRVAILELGVGLRNGVIKRMLAQIANACEHATYIVFNYSQAMAPDASCETILVDGDMAPAFEEVVRCRL